MLGGPALDYEAVNLRADRIGRKGEGEGVEIFCYGIENSRFLGVRCGREAERRGENRS